jgi:hypothetical protein
MFCTLLSHLFHVFADSPNVALSLPDVDYNTGVSSKRVMVAVSTQVESDLSNPPNACLPAWIRDF